MFNDDLFTLLDPNAADSSMNGNTPSNASATNNEDSGKEGEQKDSESWIEEDAKAWKVEKITSEIDTTATAKVNIPPVVFPTIVDLPPAPAPAKPCSSPLPIPTADEVDKTTTTTTLYQAVSDKTAVYSAPAISPQLNMNEIVANKQLPAPISMQPPPLPPLPPDPEEEEEEDDAAFLLRTKNEFSEWIQNAYR